MFEARLITAHMLSSTVRELSFRADAGFRFVPGQWVSLRIPAPNHEELSRAYSIASPPRDDGSFEIVVTRVENGLGSEILHRAEPGATFRMTHAQGFFTLDEPRRPVLMVGTGTGIAPLRSMLLAAPAEFDTTLPPFTLLFGIRAESDVLYGDEFRSLASRHSRFRFEPTLSRGSESWPGRRGYVQTHVPEIVRALGGDCDVYVCGLNRMIKEVRRVLKEDLGFTRERIHSERYD